MFQTNFTRDLLELKDVIITIVEKNDNIFKVFVEMPIVSHNCPRCNTETTNVHDYRIRIVNHVITNSNTIQLHYRQRRYVCPHCNKRFSENNSFVAKYYRISIPTIFNIVEELKDVITFKYIARKHHVSTNVIYRLFDLVAYYQPKVLPRVVSIDEFKGNAGSNKYQCILADPENGEIIDILPSRKIEDLIEYFKKCDCSKTEIFISDIFQTYQEIHKIFFKNAMFVVNKYHYVRQTTFAFEKVRKEVQKEFSDTRRIYFKHSRKLLLKHADNLTDEQAAQVDVMLKASPKLEMAYQLKELMYKACKAQTLEEFKKDFTFFILKAQASEIPYFVKTAQTYYNWQKGILNSRLTPFTNGFIEGMNNKIKVIKRIAFGYRNFERFRKRILHTT